MSKKHGQRKRRRKAAKPAIVCAGQRGEGPAALLAHLADALNACEHAGVRVRFRHGAAYSEVGVVLPPLRKGQQWVARTLTYDPLSPVEDPAGDDMDA